MAKETIKTSSIFQPNEVQKVLNSPLEWNISSNCFYLYATKKIAYEIAKNMCINQIESNQM